MRQWLVDLRQQKKWNKAQTAKQLGITRQYYGSIESGERMKKLSVHFASKVASVFGKKVDQIIKMEMEAKA